MIDAVLYLMQAELKEIRIDVESGEECLVEGYRNEFVQTVMNIVSNAVEVLRERRGAEPRIMIRLFSDHGRSIVTIADTGGGICPPYRRPDLRPLLLHKGPDKGTGIGLYMAKVIIENHMEGRLSVQNLPEGAEFRIEV